MSDRWATVRHGYRRWLDAGQRRGVRVLASTSIVCLVGLTVTGIWQFFAHETDPAFDAYEPGTPARPPSSPSTGMAEIHSLFGTATATVALVGGAWLVYKVLFALKWSVGLVLLVAVFGLISGSIVRFRAVKLEGRSFAGADRGYPQIFSGDLEFVVNSRMELGPFAIRLWTLGHLVTVPIILVVIWLGLPRTIDD